MCSADIWNWSRWAYFLALLRGSFDVEWLDTKSQQTTITFIYERWLFFHMEWQDFVSNVFLGALSCHNFSESENQNSDRSLIYVLKEPIASPLSSIHLQIDRAGLCFHWDFCLRQHIKMNAKRNTFSLKVLVSQKNTVPVSVGLLYFKYHRGKAHFLLFQSAFLCALKALSLQWFLLLCWCFLALPFHCSGLI